MITGSSPRVWGTLVLDLILILLIRFIPTGVGNANLVLADLGLPSVHPHGCGERATKVLNVEFTAGSSPRVWGTHLYSPETHLLARFIPTGVGNAL